MREPTVQQLNADLIHDMYCPASDACQDMDCGFRPMVTVTTLTVPRIRRVAVVGRLKGKGMSILYQAPKPTPGQKSWLPAGR